MTSPLALLGGTPAVTQPAPHFTWPPVDARTISAVVTQLQTAVSVYDRSGIIAELETALCAWFGVRHAVLTSSGTAALFDLYAACGIRPGDEVIVPGYTFFATVTRCTWGPSPSWPTATTTATLIPPTPHARSRPGRQPSLSPTCGACPPTCQPCAPWLTRTA